MRIAVTGASGFIGKALCTHLAAQGISMVALGRGDLADSARMRAGMRGADAVVHLAAIAHERAQALEKSGDYEALRRVNALVSESLAQACAQEGVARFLFMSSIGVFGEETQGRPFDEASPPAPRSLYAASKREAEERLRAVAEKTGLRLVIMRPTLVYGPGNGGNFLRLLRLVRRGLPLPLGGVRNRRNLTSIGNLVAAVGALLERDAPEGLFVICDSEAFSTPQIVAHLAEGMGRQARLVAVPEFLLRVAFDVAGHGDLARRLLGSLEASNAKLRAGTRWTPAPAEAALRGTARWFMEESSRCSQC